MTGRNKGFTVIGVVLVLAVVVVIGGVGLLGFVNFTANKEQESSHANIDSHDDMAMPSISTTNDLDKAAQALDDTSFDDDGQAEIDNESANF